MAFLDSFRHASGMDKTEHGVRLRAAMAARGKSRTEVADVADVGVRTVTNWARGNTMPSDKERAALRRLLGDYDNPGDPVEVAIKQSELTEDRQYAVLAVYSKNLREQREERTG